MSGRERAIRTLGAELGFRPVSPLYNVIEHIVEEDAWVSPPGAEQELACCVAEGEAGDAGGGGEFEGLVVKLGVVGLRVGKGWKRAYGDGFIVLVAGLGRCWRGMGKEG